MAFLLILVGVLAQTWESNSINYQRSLQKSFPINEVEWVSTFHSYFYDNIGIPPPKFPAEFFGQTLSITQQLDLGVRMLEFDIHYVAPFNGTAEGPLRVCYAGAGFLNCNADNWTVCTSLWGVTNLGTSDSGCTLYSYSWAQVMAELSAWMTLHPNEVVLIRIDDTLDAGEGLPATRIFDSVLRANFAGGTQILSRLDLPSMGPVWYSLDQMIALGKRLIVDAQYATLGNLTINRLVSKFSAPFLSSNEQYVKVFNGDNCSSDLYTAVSPLPGNTFISFENVASVLQLGGIMFFNGTEYTGVWSRTTVQQAKRCGLIPSIDAFSTVTAGYHVWSWAVNEPINPADCSACAYFSASDSRWRTGCCANVMPVACVNVTDRNHWTFGTSSDWANAACPSGFTFDVPRTAVSNQALLTLFSSATFTQVWLNASNCAVQVACPTPTPTPTPSPTPTPRLTSNAPTSAATSAGPTSNPITGPSGATTSPSAGPTTGPSTGPVTSPSAGPSTGPSVGPSSAGTSTGSASVSSTATQGGLSGTSGNPPKTVNSGAGIVLAAALLVL